MTNCQLIIVLFENYKQFFTYIHTQFAGFFLCNVDVILKTRRNSLSKHFKGNHFEFATRESPILLQFNFSNQLTIGAAQFNSISSPTTAC